MEIVEPDELPTDESTHKIPVAKSAQCSHLAAILTPVHGSGNKTARARALRRWMRSTYGTTCTNSRQSGALRKRMGNERPIANRPNTLSHVLLCLPERGAMRREAPISDNLDDMGNLVNEHAEQLTA